MSDMSRREALMLAGACACCAMSADAGLAADAPPADAPPAQGAGTADAAPTTKPKSVVLGKVADFKPGFSDKFAPQKLIVARLDDRLVAMTSVCTHKSCAVKIKPEDNAVLRCPCHKAEFSPQGTPTAGPAKTALPRYALTQAADGTITADLTKTFIESKWEDPAAFIPVKA